MNPANRKESAQKGKVYRSTGSHYLIRLESGEKIEATLRGKIRLDKSKSTNPVAVGDDVMLEPDNDVWAISKVLPRRNFIPRKAVNLSSRSHILCANVDQAFVIFSLEHPVTTLGYLDRLLATCEAFDVKAIIIFNKTDLNNTPELQKKQDDFFTLYSRIGYECHILNSLDQENAGLVKTLLERKTSFVVGRSGAGKSSFINVADPALDLKTGIVSDFSGRGKHTTTFAELHELSFGGAIIDMPGFKEMEVWGVEITGLRQCFPEMNELVGQCRFSNCLHRHEPGCAITAAVEDGKIATSRYYNYLGMLEELERNEKENWLGPGKN